MSLMSPFSKSQLNRMQANHVFFRECAMWVFSKACETLTVFIYSVMAAASCHSVGKLTGGMASQVFSFIYSKIVFCSKTIVLPL